MLIGCNSASFVKGQIYSSKADAVKNIAYKSYTGNDQLFAFYQSHGSFHPGELSADGPEAGNFTFVWNKYDPDTDDFNILIQTDNDVNTSTIPNLQEGGYKLRITNGTGVDTSLTAWVMLDHLKVWNTKDALGQIPAYRSNCAEGNQMSLSGFVEIDSFYYYDPLTDEAIFFENDYNMEWSSDNPDSFIPNKTSKEAMPLNTNYNPPIEDTWFILSATDSLGMTEIDSVFFDSPFTEAKFSVEYYDKTKKEWSANLTSEWSLDKGSLDAPLEVRFINESIGGSEFHWFLLDTTDSETLERDLQMESTTNFDYSPEFIYQTADETYYPYLVSINLEQGSCKDTSELEEGIEVAPSDLMIPNLFSPNGDETNEYFIFKHQSIKNFKITIVNRSGMLVYKETVTDIYAWEGWNGGVNNNSNRIVPSGPYYYVIEGMGYDNVEYKDLTWLESKKRDRENGTGGLFGGSGSTEPDSETVLTETTYTGWVYVFSGETSGSTN